MSIMLTYIGTPASDLMRHELIAPGERRTTDRGQTICEYLRVGQAGLNAGLMVLGSANHLAPA